MRPFLDGQFKGVVEGQKSDDGRKVFRAVATTPALDRYGEVVLPRGVVLDNFQKNPVLLEIHNYGKSTIGKILKIDVQDDAVIVDFVFSKDARGQEYEAKYADGEMSAFSIGFDPLSKIRLYWPWEDPPDISEVTVDLPDGSKKSIDLRSYEQVPYVIYTKWDMLELSAVPVPANPEALLLRQAGEIVRRAVAADPVRKSFIQEAVGKSMAPVIEMLEKFNAKFAVEDVKIDGPVPFEETKTSDGAWSPSDVRTALVRWASGGADTNEIKEKMNWAKYRKAFTLLDGAVDSFSSYKFLHHAIDGEEVVVVWRGLTAAMAALLADEGIDEGLKSQIHDHLASHYKTFGKAAPELKVFTAEELKAIEDEALVVEESTGEVAQPAASVASADQPEITPAPPSEDALVEIRTLMAGIDKKVSRMVTDVTEEIITLNLKLGLIEDYLGKKAAEKAVPKPEVKKKEGEEVLFELSPETLGRLERVAAPLAR